MSRTRCSTVVVVLLAVVAAACGNSRSNSPAATTSGPGASSTTTASSPAMFGDAPLPCGPASRSNAAGSDPGVTATSITIGAGDDRGYVQAEGLDKEMTEAVQALAERCNALGGINGRKLVVKTYDAAILQVQRAMQQACADKLFMLVGEGFALDAAQEETRLHCKLPAVPGYAVSAAFSNAPLMYQGVPNPVDRVPAEAFLQLAKIAPDAITKSATLVANFSADTDTRDKALAALPHYGFKFLPNSNLEYKVTGETDWSPFIRQLQGVGAKFVYWVGQCTDLQRVMRAARVNNFKAVWFADANHYEQKCAASNSDGAMDGVYVRMAFTPFEEAKYSKGVQDYLAMVTAKHETPTLLGMQATSSFLLWATAAQQCGAQLTRACVLSNIVKVHEWTGHSMHVATDPGANLPPQCGMLLQFKGTEYVRAAPSKPGTFDCDASSVASVATDSSRQAKLDANRVAQQFAGS